MLQVTQFPNTQTLGFTGGAIEVPVLARLSHRHWIPPTPFKAIPSTDTMIVLLGLHRIIIPLTCP